MEAEVPRAGTLFGPFKDEYFVAELVGLITDEFGLRACQDRHPFRRSARFDLGVCPGPCRDAITVPDYGSIAERARSFLGGDEAWIVGRLASEMERASEELRFERAARARERLAFCRRFAARQRFIGEFRTGTTFVREPAFGLTYRFEQGLVSEVTAEAGVASDLPPELTGRVEDQRFMLDRANLVYAWLGRNHRPVVRDLPGAVDG